MLALRVGLEDVDLVKVIYAVGRRVRRRDQQCLQVGFVPMRRDDDELGDAVVLPGGEQFVDRAVERLTAKPGGTGKGTSADRNPVGEGRSSQDSYSLRNGLGDTVRDEDIGSQREVRTVLVHSADRENESRISGDRPTNRRPAQLVDCE